MVSENQRIAEITLDEHTVVRRSPEIEEERAAAIADLLERNFFAPFAGPVGPYRLHLAIEEYRLNLDIYGLGDDSSVSITLPLLPFRSIVKDYFTICESYYEAVRGFRPTQIEAIDIGRRTLHDEGSRLLIERLAGRVETDHHTARRLFTLICVLHLRG